MELYSKTAAKKPRFKKIYDSWSPFLRDQVQWWRVAESTYDNFMIAAANKKRAPAKKAN